MDAVIAVLFIIALVGGWWLLMFKMNGGRAWSAPWLAFSSTGMAVVFTIAGAIGYPLGRQQRFADPTWAGHVIWPQVAVGVVAAVLAVYFWRRTLVVLAPPVLAPPAAHNQH